MLATYIEIGLKYKGITTNQYLFCYHTQAPAWDGPLGRVETNGFGWLISNFYFYSIYYGCFGGDGSRDQTPIFQII